jgi:putative salt-induced outer membrane protein
MSVRFCLPLAALALTLAAPAHAGLPDPIRAMIEAAIATGDRNKVATVVELAKQTHPDDAAEIDALQADLAAAEAAKKEEALRSAGLFDNWSGSGEIGGYQSSGNSDNVGLTASLNANRKGIDWSHRLRGRMDFQRSNGRTSREQYFASYEPRYQVNKRLFAYGLAQYENDRFQGFEGRYAVSGGLGYTMVDSSRVDLSVKAGPAYRVTDFVVGETDSRLAALLGIDFDWRITDRLTFSQNSDLVAEGGGQATAIIDSRTTSLNLMTGLDAKVSDRLSTRLSYQVKYDSDPPAGAVTTDTVSRFTLVYGF